MGRWTSDDGEPFVQMSNLHTPTETQRDRNHDASVYPLSRVQNVQKGQKHSETDPACVSTHVQIGQNGQYAARPAEPDKPNAKLRRVVPGCCECGEPIDERLPTFWGGEPYHRKCGEAAFQREKER